MLFQIWRSRMQRKKVSSSNISSIGYDESSRILEIEFNNGSIYQYLDVPKAKFVALMNADSHGKYLAAEIKDVYRYRRL